MPDASAQSSELQILISSCTFEVAAELARERDAVQASSASELEQPHHAEDGKPEKSRVQQPGTAEPGSVTSSPSAQPAQHAEAQLSEIPGPSPPNLQHSAMQHSQTSSAEQAPAPVPQDLSSDAAAGCHSPALAPDYVEASGGSGRPSFVDECVVCWEADAELIFRPCGHACACSSCAYLFLTSSALCPMCRAPIEGGIAIVG